MNYEEIKQLIEDMGKVNCEELSVELPDGVKISMKKGGTPKASESAVVTPVTSSNVVIQNIGEEVITPKVENDFKTVSSPMVGTFYDSPSPNSKPFVKVGDKVKRGQVLCIIEAMKLMNEIESEFDGEVAEICVSNEGIVDYGMPLFKIK